LNNKTNKNEIKLTCGGCFHAVHQKTGANQWQNGIETLLGQSDVEVHANLHGVEPCNCQHI
jgi:hypothetical protein